MLRLEIPSKNEKDKKWRFLKFCHKQKNKHARKRDAFLIFLLFCQKLVHTKFKPQLEINARLKTQRFEIHVNSVHGAIPK